MDFRWSDEQKTLRDLARAVFGDHATHDRLVELEQASDSVHDPVLWSALAQAGILGSVVPESHGGAGLGLLELLLVLEEAGAHVAPVPVVPTLVGGALPIDRFGDHTERDRWLPAIAAGEAIVTATVDAGTGAVPPVEATAGGEGSWTLHGRCASVPYAAEADILLVAAEHDGVTGVFLVEPGEGVAVTPQRSTNRAPIGTVDLHGAVATPLVAPGPDGAAAWQWIADRVTAAWCAVQAGVCEAAVRRLATHTSERRQFGRPIAEFQAVAQRAADAFIDAQMVRLTAWQAVFRLAHGDSAPDEVLTASFWAGDGAMRVVHAAQHLHGGIGVDVSHPLHRTFLWAKQIEHTVGTPTRSLVRLGARLAAQAV